MNSSTTTIYGLLINVLSFGNIFSYILIYIYLFVEIVKGTSYINDILLIISDYYYKAYFTYLIIIIKRDINKYWPAHYSAPRAYQC